VERPIQQQFAWARREPSPTSNHAAVLLAFLESVAPLLGVTPHNELFDPLQVHQALGDFVRRATARFEGPVSQPNFEVQALWFGTFRDPLLAIVDRHEVTFGLYRFASVEFTEWRQNFRRLHDTLAALIEIEDSSVAVLNDALAQLSPQQSLARIISEQLNRFTNRRNLNEPVSERGGFMFPDEMQEVFRAAGYRVVYLHARTNLLARLTENHSQFAWARTSAPWPEPITVPVLSSRKPDLELPLGSPLSSLSVRELGHARNLVTRDARRAFIDGDSAIERQETPRYFAAVLNALGQLAQQGSVQLPGGINEAPLNRVMEVMRLVLADHPNLPLDQKFWPRWHRETDHILSIAQEHACQRISFGQYIQRLRGSYYHEALGPMVNGFPRSAAE
jgi:hypothetical protein